MASSLNCFFNVLTSLCALTLAACSSATDPVPLSALPLDTAPVVVPLPPPDYDTTRWTELLRLDSSFVLDLRYATDSNFVGEVMYDCGRCFLRPRAAQALQRVQDSLRQRDLGLVLLDCYRPHPIQWKLWNKVPDRRYVADPRKGSQHNKGGAVDLTIRDMTTGKNLEMGTPYDYFGGEAWHRATVGFEDPIRSNREFILSLMEHFGWRPTSSEWWHYSYPLSAEEAPIDSMLWPCPK